MGPHKAKAMADPKAAAAMASDTSWILQVAAYEQGLV